MARKDPVVRARTGAFSAAFVAIWVSGCMLLLDDPYTSQTECDSIGDSCDCSFKEDGNNELCSEQSVGDGVCCAESGWPGGGAGCSCDKFSCTGPKGNCSCDLYGFGDEPSCTGPICCEEGSRCQCGDDPCTTSETVVPSCGRSTAKCDGESTRVTVCSIFEVPDP